MNSESLQEIRDCAVCLQKCHYPTQLPCGHIFCFLCVKGIAIQNKRCAMCRAEIPRDYLDHPVFVGKILAVQTSTEVSEEYQWYYEGRNGWWKYDERSNSELEAAINSGERQCKLLLAGALYCVDFQTMVQIQSRDHSRRRRVRRDTPTLPAKGIAGIKIAGNIYGEPTKSESEDSPNNNLDQLQEVIEIVDDAQSDNESAASPQNNSIDGVVERISSMDLQERIPNERASTFITRTEET